MWFCPLAPDLKELKYSENVERFVVGGKKSDNKTPTLLALEETGSQRRRELEELADSSRIPPQQREAYPSSQFCSPRHLGVGSPSPLGSSGHTTFCLPFPLPLFPEVPLKSR